MNDLSVATHSEPSELPSREQLALIDVGRYVRLQLQGGSRIWAEVVTARRSNGTWIGRADDSADGVKLNDLVCFGAEHVYQVL